MSFEKMKEAYFAKKNKSLKEIKHFYNDLNLIWSNCFEYNKDRSSISNEAKKLRKLANKLIKERILNQENPIKIESDNEEEKKEEIKIKEIPKSKNKNKKGRSNSVSSVGGQNNIEDSTVNSKNKKAKFQTSINLNIMSAAATNSSSKANIKLNTCNNLKTVDPKEEFKAPAFKGSKANGNKAKNPKEDDNKIKNVKKESNKADNRAKSANQKQSSGKLKKVINDDSMEDSIERIKESKVKIEDKPSEAGSSSKITKILVSDAVMDLEKKNNNNKDNVKNDHSNSTEKQNEEKDTHIGNILNELKAEIEVEEASNEKENLSAAKQEAEIIKAESADDSIEIKKIKILAIAENETQLADKMEIDGEQAPLDSNTAQASKEEFKDSATNSNCENKILNINEIEQKLEAENQTAIESEAKETPEKNKAEKILCEVANEIEMAVEPEVKNQAPNSLNNEIPNDCNANINNLNQTSKVNESSGETKKLKSRKSCSSEKYGYDLYDDIRRFNCRVSKNGDETIKEVDFYRDKIKRQRKQVDYKINQSAKAIKNDQKLPASKINNKDENANKNSSLNEEKDNKINVETDNNTENKVNKKESVANNFQTNSKKKKSSSNIQKSFRCLDIEQIKKKVTNDTIHFDADDTKEEEKIINENKKKGKSNKIEKKTKDTNEDEEEFESENLNDYKAKGKADAKTTIKSKGKTKIINLSLNEEEEKNKEKEEANSEIDSEAEIK